MIVDRVTKLTDLRRGSRVLRLTFTASGEDDARWLFDRLSNLTKTVAI